TYRDVQPEEGDQSDVQRARRGAAGGRGAAGRRQSRRRTGGVRRDRGRARPRGAPSAGGRARSRARLGESPAVRDGGPAAYPRSYAGGTTGFPAAFHPFSPSTITLTSV